MRLVDLHCHTHCSDGTLSPPDLLALASSRGVDLISVTDHDTVLAYRNFGAIPKGLSLVEGIEFSTQWHRKSVHIVGLNIDSESSVIAEATRQQAAYRLERAQRIAEQFDKVGINGALEGALAIAGVGTVGRPHFAKYLVQQQICKDEQQAFKRYLGKGKLGDVKMSWAELPQIIEWILAAGGVAVLAHPGKYKMNRRQLLQLVDEFIRCGGTGIEVLSGHQDAQTTELLVGIAVNKGLLASVGSDFHSPEHRWIRLGMHAELPSSACIPIWDAF